MILKKNANFIVMSLGSTPTEKEKEEIKMATKGASNRYGNTRGSN